jgi:H+/gluconate symporter-like permease
MSLFGIILGLGLLMILAYRGYSIVWIGPLCAALVAAMGGLKVIDTYIGAYMAGTVGYINTWFPTFLLSAIFGSLMDMTGGAEALAIWLTKKIGKRGAIATVVIVCGILTYGGISLFVVVFAMYPLTLAMFRESNISRKIIPGAIALGAFEFTMTAVPGSPQIQNLIPMKYFGTTPTAAPILGIVATILSAGIGIWYLEWKRKKLDAKGDQFTEPEAKFKGKVLHDAAHLPNPILSLVPMIAVIVVLNVIPPLIGLKGNDPRNIIYALLVGIFLTFILNWSRREVFIPAIGEGAAGSVGAIMNTGAAVGFGAVVKAVPGFAVLTQWVLGIGGSNPLISLAVALNILAGATGSASGGMTIALDALGAKYLQLGLEQGINPEALHRVASVSAGALDSLPQNGAVLTLLQNTGMSHKDSYGDIFAVTVVLPVFIVIVLIILATFGIA